jgi:hypothetical protein
MSSISNLCQKHGRHPLHSHTKDEPLKVKQTCFVPSTKWSGLALTGSQRKQLLLCTEREGRNKTVFNPDPDTSGRQDKFMVQRTSVKPNR